MKALAGAVHRAAAAAARGVTPAVDVAEVLDRIGLRGFAARYDPDLLPDPATLRMRRLYDALLQEAAAEVTTALDEAGVTHFFAKGIAFLGAVYAPGERVTSDIDLYVAPAARRAAVAALERIGFRPLPEGDQAGPPELRSALALARPAASGYEAAVDLHWGFDPVTRLLPRAGCGTPPALFAELTTSNSLPVPIAPIHGAVLAHHLVRADLLHPRSVVDLSLLLMRATDHDGTRYVNAAGLLGVGRFARAIASAAAVDFEIQLPTSMLARNASERRLASKLRLDGIILTALRAPAGTAEVVTTSRIRTRVRLVGPAAVAPLAADAVLPPRAFLRWRWPHLSPLGARWRHLTQVGRKIAASSGDLNHTATGQAG